MKTVIIALATCFTLTAATICFAAQDGLVGVWTTEEAKSKVEIYNCGQKFCAKIISLKEPLYVVAKDGPVGTAKTDRNNADSVRQKTPIIGLQIMAGFTPSGENSWGNGTIYDPENGKTYQCKLKLDGPGRLNVRGFIGISLLGRTTVWTR